MKKLFTIVSGIFLFLPQLGFSQNGKICNWKDDKKASVVLTFDDWSPGHYPVVVPELNTRNLKATFFLTLNSVASWNHDWPTVLTTAAAGHEMGNHTSTHPNLTTVSASDLHKEISAVRDTIQKRVTSQKILSFAYPLGAGTGNTAKELEVRDTVRKKHIAARGVSPAATYTYNFATSADDYFKINSYAMGSSTTTKTFTDEVQRGINGKGLVVYLYHSVDDATNSHGDNWYAKVQKDSLKKQLDALVNLQDKIWVTTFGEAVKYHKEKNSATLTEVQAPTGTLWTLNLSDTLADNNLYNVPLTLKMKMNGVAYDAVTQNGNALTYTIAGDTISFNAVPDGGLISLTVANQAPTLDALANLSIDQNDPTQTVDFSGITAGTGETQNLSVSITAQNTNLVKNIVVNYNSPDATGSFSFDPNPLVAGVTTVTVRVTDNGTPVKYFERSFTLTVAGITSSAKAILSEIDLKLSPNPVTDLLTIETSRSLSAASVSVEDLSGAVVYEGFFASAEKIQLNLSGKKSGVYVLRIKSEQGTVVKKLVIL